MTAARRAALPRAAGKGWAARADPRIVDTMRSPADALAAVKPHAWRHRTAILQGRRHDMLVFDFAKTDPARRQMLLADLQLDSLPDHATSKQGVGHRWVHPTRVPFALAAIDAGPFVIDGKDIVGAYGPLRWFLLLDSATGEVWGVDVGAGYVAETGAEVVRLAASVAELDITAAGAP